MASPALDQDVAILKTPGRIPIFETIRTSIPDVGPRELLVRLSATGVCGTDYGLASGHLGPTCSILGHEGVGRVVRLGDAVPETLFPIGLRVGVSWIREVCGVCGPCLTPGGETRCRAQKQSGGKTDGTFCQYTVIPMTYVIALPEDVSDMLVAPILCGGVTAYKALKICGALPGQLVAISGAGGGVGNLAIRYAKAMGYRVMALDVGETKEADTLKAGAEQYIDVSSSENVARAVQAITKDGVNAVIVTAPSHAAYQSAIGLLAPFGTLVCVGIPPASDALKVHPLELIEKDIRLIGSAVGTRGEIREALDFVRRGVVVPTTESATLYDLNHIIAGYASGQGSSKYVITL